MAQDRFYFWRGYYDALKKLPTDEHRGEFTLALCAYAFDGIEPDFSDDLLLDFAWSLVADSARESVMLGRMQSERGSKGGRPTKVKKTTAKSGAKTTAKTTALSGAKSGAESGAETTAESVRYGNVLSPSETEREYASHASADAGVRASKSAPQIAEIPPKPEGDW